MWLKKALPDFRKETSKVVAARIFVIILLVANLAFIWINSAKTANESTKSSESITRSVAPLVLENYEKMTAKEKDSKISELDSKVRTTAHMLEYIPLGTLIFLLIITVFDVKLKDKKNMFMLMLGILAALLFALSDEVHQIFVDGRSFEIKDIGMDMLGMFIGFVFGVIPFGIYKKSKNTDI